MSFDIYLIILYFKNFCRLLTIRGKKCQGEKYIQGLPFYIRYSDFQNLYSMQWTILSSIIFITTFYRKLTLQEIFQDSQENLSKQRKRIVIIGKKCIKINKLKSKHSTAIVFMKLLLLYDNSIER